VLALWRRSVQVGRDHSQLAEAGYDMHRQCMLAWQRSSWYRSWRCMGACQVLRFAAYSCCCVYARVPCTSGCMQPEGGTPLTRVTSPPPHGLPHDA
jgi:hypothetical protein